MLYMKRMQQQQQPESKKFSEQQGQQEQQSAPVTNTLHTPLTKRMEETVHIPGAWADLLLNGAA